MVFLSWSLQPPANLPIHWPLQTQHSHHPNRHEGRTWISVIEVALGNICFRSIVAPLPRASRLFLPTAVVLYV